MNLIQDLARPISDRGPSPSHGYGVSARRWGWKTVIFRGATTVALFHALDDSLFNRQHGTDVDQHALAVLIALVAGLTSIAAFPLLPTLAAAGIALVFGVLAAVNGSLHIVHVGMDGVGGSDVSGVLCAVAGASLLILGVVIPFTSSRTISSGRKRWIYKYREPIGDPPAGSYRAVTFATSDALRLSGWYVPSKNGAAVIVVHG